jgi:hypothetical protein
MTCGSEEFSVIRQVSGQFIDVCWCGEFLAFVEVSKVTVWDLNDETWYWSSNENIVSGVMIEGGIVIVLTASGRIGTAKISDEGNHEFTVFAEITVGEGWQLSYIAEQMLLCFTGPPGRILLIKPQDLLVRPERRLEIDLGCPLSFKHCMSEDKSIAIFQSGTTLITLQFGRDSIRISKENIPGLLAVFRHLDDATTCYCEGKRFFKFMPKQSANGPSSNFVEVPATFWAVAERKCKGIELSVPDSTISLDCLLSRGSYEFGRGQMDKRIQIRMKTKQKVLIGFIMKVSVAPDTVIFFNNRQISVVSKMLVCPLKESEVELEGSYLLTIQSSQSVRLHYFEPYVIAANKLYVDRVKAGRDKLDCEGRGLFDIVMEKKSGDELDTIVWNLAGAVGKVRDERLLHQVIGAIYKHERFSEPLRQIVAKTAIENEERVRNIWKEELKNLVVTNAIGNREIIWKDLLKFHKRSRREIGVHLWKDWGDDCGVYGFCSAFIL